MVSPYCLRMRVISLAGMLMSVSVFLFVLSSGGCIITMKRVLLGVAKNYAEPKCKQVPMDSSEGYGWQLCDISHLAACLADQDITDR